MYAQADRKRDLSSSRTNWDLAGEISWQVSTSHAELVRYRKGQPISRGKDFMSVEFKIRRELRELCANYCCVTYQG